MLRRQPSGALTCHRSYGFSDLGREGVGERSLSSEAESVNSGGAQGSENVGMSSESSVRNTATEIPEVS